MWFSPPMPSTHSWSPAEQSAHHGTPMDVHTCVELQGLSHPLYLPPDLIPKPRDGASELSCLLQIFLPPPRRGATLSDRFLAFILPGFFLVFFWGGGKEILVSQRGQGVHLLRGGWGCERAASSGLRGNNLLAFLTFLLLSLSWEIMKITSFSHC